jgi:hypothetical protein
VPLDEPGSLPIQLAGKKRAEDPLEIHRRILLLVRSTPAKAKVDPSKWRAEMLIPLLLCIAPLFLCLGFCIAVVYMDLVFDLSALPYRKLKTNLSNDILNPIITYYAYVTKNPWLLIFAMFTATACLIMEVVFQLVPRWAGYSSLVLFGVVMLLGVARIIPLASRLAARKDAAEKQTLIVHSLAPYHIFVMILLLTLALMQFSTIPR